MPAIKLLVEIKEILLKFLDKYEVNKFIKLLFYDKPKPVQTSNNNNAEDNRLKMDIPAGRINSDQVDKFITFLENNLPDKDLLNLYLKLIQVLIDHCELVIAEELVNKVLLKTGNSEKFKNQKACVLLAFSKIKWLQNKWESAFHDVQEAIKIYLKDFNILGLAKCQNMISTIYGEQGDVINAVKHIREGLLLLDGSNEHQLKAMLNKNMGVMLSLKGDYHEAISYFNDAVKFYKYLGDYYFMARVCYNIALLYSKLGENLKALEFFNNSLEIFASKHQHSKCTISFLGKAYIYYRIKEYELAESFVDKALETAIKVNNRQLIAEINGIKTHLTNGGDNIELSEELFEVCIRLNKDFDSLSNIIDESEEISELNSVICEKDISKEFLKTHLNITKKLV
ncbi:tetratricopeptide repeat protein [Bacteroidota bacterium]